MLKHCLFRHKKFACSWKVHLSMNERSAGCMLMLAAAVAGVLAFRTRYTLLFFDVFAFNQVFFPDVLHMWSWPFLNFALQIFKI